MKLSIEEIYYDSKYRVKSDGRVVMVNQIDHQSGSVSDCVGVWYCVDELEELDKLQVNQ